MAPTQTVHHHRSTTKTSHKPFKSKHASKGALKDINKGMNALFCVNITTLERL